MHLKFPMYNARFMLFNVELSAVTRKKIMLRNAYLLCRTVLFLFIRWLRIYCYCETFIETRTFFSTGRCLISKYIKNDFFRVYKFQIIISRFVLFFFLFFFISLSLYPFPLSQKLLTSLSPSLRPICL